MSFHLLGLCDTLLNTLAEKSYTTPSPIQIDAIPAVLSGRDVMAIAQTGTGKTAAFALPVAQLLAGGASPLAKNVRGLIIAPTRELAAQVAKSVEIYSRHMNICSGAVFGGVRIEPQIAMLENGLDILVATPGRLLDLYNQQAIGFDQLEILVLDEADRMLELGFVDDIRTIQNLLPSKYQTLMFSATFSKPITALAKGMLTNPLVIEVTAANSTVDSVKQLIYPVDKNRKTDVLIHLIKKHKWRQILVFSRTKRGADELVSQLKSAHISAESIHANRTQHARTLALDGFGNGDIQVLVATDIASRGIDINQLPCVINFDLPYVAEDYVHRVGRTGRADNTGLAISLFSEDESKQLQSIERLIGRTLPREIIAGFAPREKAPCEKAPSKSAPSRKATSEKAPLETTSDEDLYGNFEPDPKLKSKHGSRGQPKGERGSFGKQSSRKRRR